MHYTSIFIAAAGASVAAAQDYAPPAPLDTTTLTSTTTRVVTLTQCNPTVTDCPLRTHTSTEVVVTTSTAEPEVPAEPTTSVYVAPTTSIYEPVVNTTSHHEVPTIVNTPTIITTKKAPLPKTTFYPAGNTTVKAGPTAPVSHVTKLPVPSSNGTPEKPGYEAPPATTPEAPSSVPTAGASGLIASSGLIGAAMVAAMVALF
ncbi:hypothetical protein FSPOR_2604 [Fusarium sporotrichioides]|jgi:hypothetical protein|uniref:Gpi anchored serine-rich n=1 Tax=Fusarium sporotrichioides TaxID=5514 RepID=A0A395SJC8_FUSSP|nr:hypothetical protein FSPOR_2604 [Fusarium sporotrichioides]